MLSYLIFGVLTTLLNIVLYALFNKLFGYTAANSWGNVLDNILCILFAYCTNRAFVFRSRTAGQGHGEGVWCIRHLPSGHNGAGAAIMMVVGNLLAAQGAALMDEPDAGGCLTPWSTGLARIRPSRWQPPIRAHAAGGHGWLCRHCRHRRADGPTAIFVPAATMRRHCGALP